MLKVARLQVRIPTVTERTDLYYARGAQGVQPMRVGVPPVIWIYVPDAIVRRLLCSTATRSSPLGYFSRLLQVVDN